MLIFSLDGSDPLAEALCAALDEPRSPHEDRAFEDGERKIRPLVDPRGADAYVIASLHGSPGPDDLSDAAARGDTRSMTRCAAVRDLSTW